MKSLIPLLVAGLLTNLTHAQKETPALSADNQLKKVYTALQSLKSIKYDNIRELNYASENYHNLSSWTCYYNFESRDTLTGIKYQVENSSSTQIFNGTESFYLDKTKKTIKINDHPVKSNFDAFSFFYNSIVTLRNVLPLLINDKTVAKSIADTMINNTPYLLVTINIGKRRIRNLGNDFDAMQTKNNFIYKIAVRKDNYLPYEVVQGNDLNPDFIKTTFANIDITPATPEEFSWYYSTYTSDYKIAVSENTPKMIEVGSLAPGWKLPTHDDREIALGDLKGQVILLDFWIRNCGPCIASIPHLNKLQDKFRGKNFKVISINSYDSKTDVNWIRNKFKTNYTVLLNGKAVAEKYGVSGSYPSFVIIDKTGKIIYARTGFDPAVQPEVEKVIQQAL